MFIWESALNTAEPAFKVIDPVAFEGLNVNWPAPAFVNELAAITPDIVLVPLFVTETSPEAVTAAALKAAPFTVILFSAVDPPTAPEKVTLSVPASTTKFLPEEFPFTVPVKVMESLLASIVELDVRTTFPFNLISSLAELTFSDVYDL